MESIGGLGLEEVLLYGFDPIENLGLKSVTKITENDGKTIYELNKNKITAELREFGCDISGLIAKQLDECVGEDGKLIIEYQ